MSRSPFAHLSLRRGKRPPATPARLALGAVLFGGCALGAWLTLPRPDVRVINASGQPITVTVDGAGAAASRSLGVNRVWAVEPRFAAGTPLRFRVALPDRAEQETTFSTPTLPLRVAVTEEGRVTPR
ncbi:hypothetical protein [Deinococcus aerophilus]|uniref:Uncharacterized protein n=1 Tax=Deinococcus aerophilus TaxID=522488 RepID=A0ABQ2GL94_9DEIO|nr:hypothetical protein [Deinococcus aerophilus]GGM01971.1 hypothetical protein GCM10010841_07990 [Deinococcus aerophilus]